MQDLAHLPAFVAWAAFGLAVVFGAVANRVNFCAMGAVTYYYHLHEDDQDSENTNGVALVHTYFGARLST